MNININALKIRKLTFHFLCVISGVRREGTTVLNIFNDHDYNRSVITIVATIDSIGKFASTTFGLYNDIVKHPKGLGDSLFVPLLSNPFLYLIVKAYYNIKFEL